MSNVELVTLCWADVRISFNLPELTPRFLGMKPSLGSTIPDMPLTVVEGGQTTEIRLTDFSGRKVVLFFYPKDATPG